MNFLDLQMGDHIPDAKTIWDFKELIENDGRDGSNKLFSYFHQMLDQKGLIAKAGSIIDASFVDAPKQRNSRDQNKKLKEGECPEGFEKDTSKGAQKDCDARWAKKNNQTHFGYKNHAKVDLKSKLIDSYATTPASTHDSQIFEELLAKKDQAILADSAYKSEKNEQVILDHNLEGFIIAKAYRNKPLTEQQQRFNKTVSRMRVRVEHVFGRMKYIGADLFRKIGIQRARQHNALCNLTYNMDRYALLVA